MRTRIKIVIVFIILSVVSVGGCFAYSYKSSFMPDKSWITDLGYKENEIYELSYNWVRGVGCPQIPVKVEDYECSLLFDTGCGVGISFTNVVEDNIKYTLIG